MVTGPVGPFEVYFYWPIAILRIFLLDLGQQSRYLLKIQGSLLIMNLRSLKY